MEYVYAALLLHRLNKDINETNITKVVKAAGVDPDSMKIKALVSALGGVNIEEAIKSASFVPSGGPSSTSAPATEAKAPQPTAKKKEEEIKEKPKEEEALEGLSSLFGS